MSSQVNQPTEIAKLINDYYNQLELLQEMVDDKEIIRPIDTIKEELSSLHNCVIKILNYCELLTNNN